MLEVGQQVRVLEPFTIDFPDVYTIQDIVISEDGSMAYILGDGIGFSIEYLEIV